MTRLSVERRAELRAIADAGQCTYVGRCNGSGCPKHGGAAKAVRALLDELDAQERATMDVMAAESVTALRLAEAIAERDDLQARLLVMTRERDAARDAIDATRLPRDERVEAMRKRARDLVERDPVQALANIATALAVEHIEEADAWKARALDAEAALATVTRERDEAADAAQGLRNLRAQWLHEIHEWQRAWFGPAASLASRASRYSLMRSRVDDCGDSGCIFRDRSKPSGMRTNGGCMHLTEHPSEVRMTLVEAAAELTALRRVAECAREVDEADSTGDDTIMGIAVRHLRLALAALPRKEGTPP